MKTIKAHINFGDVTGQHGRENVAVFLTLNVIRNHVSLNCSSTGSLIHSSELEKQLAGLGAEHSSLTYHGHAGGHAFSVEYLQDSVTIIPSNPTKMVPGSSGQEQQIDLAFYITLLLDLTNGFAVSQLVS